LLADWLACWLGVIGWLRLTDCEKLAGFDWLTVVGWL
jgi:hypothetical protein